MGSTLSEIERREESDIFLLHFLQSGENRGVNEKGREMSHPGRNRKENGDGGYCFLLLYLG